MLCEFADIRCAMPGNFVCRKCKQCGHEVGLPQTVAETHWDTVHQNIKNNCKHRDANSVPAAPTPTPEVAAITPPPENGPGAQLKNLLAKVGIRATPTCACNARARYMDFMGIVWCEQNIATIIGWLKEEADKRGLPFIEIGARALVNRAIALAKKAQKQNLERNT